VRNIKEKSIWKNTGTAELMKKPLTQLKEIKSLHFAFLCGLITNFCTICYSTIFTGCHLEKWTGNCEKVLSRMLKGVPHETFSA